MAILTSGSPPSVNVQRIVAGGAVLRVKNKVPQGLPKGTFSSKNLPVSLNSCLIWCIWSICCHLASNSIDSTQTSDKSAIELVCISEIQLNWCNGGSPVSQDVGLTNTTESAKEHTAHAVLVCNARCSEGFLCSADASKVSLPRLVHVVSREHLRCSLDLL